MQLHEARIMWARACLVAEVARGRTQGYLTGPALEAPPEPRAFRAELASDPPAITAAFARLHISELDADIVWLLAACELEPTLARMVEVANEGRAAQLTRQQVMRILDVPGAAIDRLVDARVIATADATLPAHRRALRACDRVLDLVTGHDGLDRSLATCAEWLVARPSGVDGAGAVQADAVISRAIAQRALIVAVGDSSSDASSHLERHAAAAGCNVIAIDASSIAATPDLLAILARECALADAIPLVRDADALLARGGALEHVLARFTGPVLATTTAPPSGTFGRPIVRVEVPAPSTGQRAAQWAEALAGCDRAVVDACARHFHVSSSTIRAAARGAEIHAGDAAAVSFADVKRGMRDLLDHRVAGLARRVEWHQHWSDLVLPPDQLDMLAELIARVRHRDHVLETWGFGAKVGKGHGVAALVSGAPGTGKTMIAGLIASELGLDLYQVDLSRVVSKYIGETEKQLGALFDAAESGQAMLLFDEADSLFGKRTEVKSSNDRYANLETNYLLQRLEAFTGICLLTTNHEKAIDEAFIRRLALHIRVPTPDEDHRAKLWRAMLPTAAVVAADIELAFDRLAHDFDMTGGHIKNAVLRAAYVAAADGGAIHASHLRAAACAEYESMGKIAG